MLKRMLKRYLITAIVSIPPLKYHITKIYNFRGIVVDFPGYF